MDVITWLAQQNVPLVLLSWQGEVVNVIGQGGPYHPVLRQAQLAALTNGVGLELATRLIRDKVAASQETLETFWRSPSRDNGLRKLEGIRKELETVPPNTDALRMIEARAALAYFLCWQEVPLRWKGIGRKPIPEEWHRCGMRQGILRDGTNRHATHPVNAMLNYAYTVLESQVRVCVTAEGLDPTIGYLHTQRPGRVALVYDLMEPLRPRVDGLVLDFLRSHILSPTDFALDRRGICRLHSQLCRHVAQLSVQASQVEETVKMAKGLFAQPE